MYKLYQGNTGRVRRVEEGPERPAPAAQPVPAPPPVRQPGPPQQRPRPSGPLGQLLPGVLEDLETEDLLLLLILYLMYRESGDSELLMIMGGMFLL